LIAVAQSKISRKRAAAATATLIDTGSTDMGPLFRASLLALLVVAGSARSSPDSSVAAFAWLAGCWANVAGEFGTGEVWTAPAGGTMLGVSRTVRDGKTVEYEFMQIREIAPGQLAFVAHPSGQAQAAFPLVQSSPGELVFEDPAHDFPQRVIYRLVPPDRLHARIEGTLQGKDRGVDFHMKRAECTRPD
jgi:hypothetical protein